MTRKHPRAFPGGHEAGMTYHQRMLGDPHRVTAYDRAIRRLVKPGDVVLDVGSGSGVLSLMAARAGARVHAVESQDVATLAAAVAQANGLDDRVHHHQCDIRDLQVIEPVDLIISDFMGRFVFDDLMREAMNAALRWLKPDGKVCPESLDLYLAPVHLGHFAPLDTGIEPLLGLDFAPITQAVSAETMGIELEPSLLLAAPQRFTHLAMRKSMPQTYAKVTDFVTLRAGRCRGVAGWFNAQLAPGVALSTEPGMETHWGQLLFPCAPRQVGSGDAITFELSIETDKPNSHWQWALQVPNDVEMARPAPQAQPAPASASSATAANDLGIQHFQAGEFVCAANQFLLAISLLDADDNPRATELYENLGLAYFNAGNYVPAVTAFLRSLEGEPTSREQALKFLVDACFQSHRPRDGSRYLATYEQAFGPHPSGWHTGPQTSGD